MGLTVEWVQDGDICDAMVEQSLRYDLILMNIQMPNMNGYQAYAAGMDAHLVKPIDIEKLEQTLADLLKGYRKNTE